MSECNLFRLRTGTMYTARVAEIDGFLWVRVGDVRDGITRYKSVATGRMRGFTSYEVEQADEHPLP